MTTPSSQLACELQAIRARAILYQHIREFFVRQQVMEVETPILQLAQHHGHLALAGQPHLEPLAQISDLPISDLPMVLHRSPACAMQQLLVYGSGAIYQMCKVFRGAKKAHEQHRKSSQEFSMLAWYTPNASLVQLMQNSQDLLACVFGYHVDIATISYQDAFQRRLDINPHQATITQLKALARRVGLTDHYADDRMAWLDALFCHFVEPTLGYNQPVFLTDLPVDMAITVPTKINENDIPVAPKFRLYIDGLKLASGQERQASHLPQDQHAVLSYGRISLGLDRLLMLLMDKLRIDQVVSFNSPMILASPPT